MTFLTISKRYVFLLALICASLVAQNAGSIHGVVTDPSGAAVPNAVIGVKGAAAEAHTKADGNGRYSVANLPSGKYVVAIGAKGFAVSKNTDVNVSGATTLDVQLVIKGEAQIVNVEDEVNGVTSDPASNGTALVLGQKELAALSDDPDELSQELQAMAGPGGGPNGGQIYVDGFTGGNMPPKSSIREVRINSNPYSTEYDRPGFGRIEIFTKPGTDKIRGQSFFQYNDQNFNSRSPLLTSSTRAPYGNKIGGFNITGPIKTNKASYGFDFERRNITENAFVNAITLDSSLNPQSVNQSVVTPQTRTNFSPRLDYSINQKNTLVVRYQFTRIGFDETGVGNLNLASQGYKSTEGEQSIQATETAVLSPTMINESRFQFMHTSVSDEAKSTSPTINVAGAFTNGGVAIGNSGSTGNRAEFTNASTLTRGTHTYKFGGRLRQTLSNDTSLSGFNGTFIFQGRQGPVLDAANQPTSALVQLTALEVYRRTLLGQQLGLSAAGIRAIGGGASQFTLSTGTALTSIRQFDAGLFFNDDWKLKPNLTFSYGLRYEAQTNIGDLSNVAPRMGVAWGIGGGVNKQAKTVLRAGAGVFYDRVADSVSLAAQRYNGLTQQSYFLLNPDFYPNLPSVSLLGSSLPQQYRPLYSGVDAPRTYQASIGIERQISKAVKLSGQYLESRGVHLQNSRNINVPVNGIYPFGDSGPRVLTESAGLSRTHQLFISPNVNYKKMFLFGFYAFSHGKNNNEGSPADPNNLSAEYGPSSFADVRHRFVVGTSIPAPLKISISPFIMANSGSPYTITTGQDTNHDGYTNERPSLDASLSAAACSGKTLVYEFGFGCFNLNPAPGTQIGRNSARGPASFTVNMRVARTWSFGKKGESGARDNGGPAPGMGGIRGGGPPPGGGPGGGGPPPGGGGGGPMMFGGGAASGKKYNLTLTVSARNLLNHASYAAPNGDLSSRFFGSYTSLAGGFGPMGGASTFGRKIDLQLRFQF